MKLLFDIKDLNTYKNSDLLPLECEFCTKKFLISKIRVNHSLKYPERNKCKFCCSDCLSKSRIMRFKIACSHCNKIFEKCPGIVKRNNFCSRECINSHIAHRKKYNPFKLYLSRIKTACRYHFREDKNSTNLTVEYLEEVWKSQKGICPYTGFEMPLPKTYVDFITRKNKLPIKPSLDRIDSSKGYIQGNVEFVCVAINYAKNSFTKTQMLLFIKEMRENYAR